MFSQRFVSHFLKFTIVDDSLLIWIVMKCRTFSISLQVFEITNLSDAEADIGASYIYVNNCKIVYCTNTHVLSPLRLHSIIALVFYYFFFHQHLYACYNKELYRDYIYIYIYVDNFSSDSVRCRDTNSIWIKTYPFIHSS